MLALALVAALGQPARAQSAVDAATAASDRQTLQPSSFEQVRGARLAAETAVPRRTGNSHLPDPAQLTQPAPPESGSSEDPSSAAAPVVWAPADATGEEWTQPADDRLLEESLWAQGTPTPGTTTTPVPGTTTTPVPGTTTTPAPGTTTTPVPGTATDPSSVPAPPVRPAPPLTPALPDAGSSSPGTVPPAGR